MRFDCLNIPAFGPFTDFNLDLPKSKDGYDLHIIYGENEKGKSSLLRAIDHLIFGIPTRSDDNFIHPFDRLRIGATISTKDQTLSFMRKKGRINTLLDRDNNTLPEAGLTTLLGAIDQSFFRSMFGLNTENLRNGGKQIIAGEGSLGATLFSAALGSTPIDTAISALKTEADALFKSGGQKNAIAQAMAEHKAATTAAKKAIVPTHLWETHRKDLALAQKQFEEIDAAFSQQKQRHLKLERFLNALPSIYKLRQLESELAALAHIPDLAQDFTEQVRNSQKHCSDLQQAIEFTTRSLTLEQEQLAHLQPQTQVLDHESEITLLHQGISQHLERRGLRSTEELPDISHLPHVPEEALNTYHDIVADEKELTQTIKQLRTQLDALERDITSIRKELAAIPPGEIPPELNALATAVTAHNPERSHLTDLSQTIQTTQTKLDSLIVRLGTPDSPQQLNPPSLEAAKQLQQLISSTENRQTQLKDDIVMLKNRLSDEQALLSNLKGRTSLTTRSELLESRNLRDQLIQAAASSGQMNPEIAPAVSRTDELADALHTHAESIARAESHKTQVAQLESHIQLLEAECASTAAHHSEQLQAWNNTLADRKLPPLSPVEYIDWHHNWSEWCTASNLLNDCQTRQSLISEQTKQLTSKLQSALNSVEDDYSILCEILQQQINASTKASGIRESLEAQEKELERKHRTLEESLSEQRSSQDKLRQELTALTTPFAGDLPLPALHSAQQQVFITAQCDRFETQLTKTASHLLEKQHNSEEETVNALYILLQKEKDNASKAQQSEAHITRLKAELDAQQANLETAKSVLTRLQTSAKAHDLNTLESVLAGIEKKSLLNRAATDQRDNLTTIAAGEDLNAFIAQATAQSEADLIDEKDHLDADFNHQQQLRDIARARLDELLKKQAEFETASSFAADETQRAELFLASASSDAKRFIQIQHAITFLQEQIEVYRQRSQGPMLTRTSALFSQLTSGAFQKVAAQHNDKGEPYLVAIRSDGQSVETHHMSEGTADQLYLALRIASLQLHLESHPPMPLILDDLLMTFDDTRTSALLPILAELSKKTQILIFTHHQHLRNLFSETIPDQFTAHQLM